MHHRRPPNKPEQAQAYVDQKRVVAHMRELAENELEDSPNKGPKKKLTMLADVLERTIESGASAANMGYAVRERYKDMFGGQPLEDVSMLDNTDDALASAQKTVRKKAACRSLFGDGDQKQEPRHLRVRLRRVGDVDVSVHCLHAQRQARAVESSRACRPKRQSGSGQSALSNGKFSATFACPTGAELDEQDVVNERCMDKCRGCHLIRSSA